LRSTTRSSSAERTPTTRGAPASSTSSSAMTRSLAVRRGLLDAAGCVTVVCAGSCAGGEGVDLMLRGLKRSSYKMEERWLKY
jgi:hypothetical protein